MARKLSLPGAAAPAAFFRRVSALSASRLGNFGALNRSHPLLALSLMETSGPLIRMFALTHLLPLREVGLATILAAFVGVLEVSTDIAIHRFIFSAPRDMFDEAVAAAHALAVARGVVLSALAFCIAPVIAAALSLSDDWVSFAILAPTLFLRSLTHLGPRIAERDFQYGAQIKSSSAAYAGGLVALIAVGVATHSYVAVIAGTYGQDVMLVIASRIFAGSPFRLNFRSPLFRQASRYAYPLVFNGMGLAVTQQADRFLVAALFDLKIVAVYSIIVTTALYPGQVISRFFTTTIIARLYHASLVKSRLLHEVSLSSSLSAVIAAFYAGGVIFLTDFVATAVFGPKFHVSSLAMAFLGLGAFVRFIRVEPFNALMLNVGRTKRLAASNLLVSTTLVYMAAVALVDRSMEAILLTRVLGEFTALIFTIYIARQVAETGRLVFSRSDLVGLGFVVAACLGSYELWRSGGSLAATLAACVVYTIAIAIWVVWELRSARSREEKLLAEVGKA
jgi:O-antigen/teichoic acid export membrane protein